MPEHSNTIEERRAEIESARIPAFELAPTDQPGFSRLGGLPLVPAGFEWPMREEVSLTFLAQLDLSEVSDPRLPASGYLYFFYDEEDWPWGDEPWDKEGWKVLFIEGDASEFVLAEADEDLETYPEKPIRLRPMLAYPPAYMVGIDDEDEEEKYEELAATAFEGACHQLLGLPGTFEDKNMPEYCVYYYSKKPDSPAKDEERQKREAEWKLLLQLDSDDSVGFCWGDVGRLYFWIQEDDLAQKDFDHVWMVLKSH